jgi:RND family efflux transporter MFP subunit
MIPTRAIFLTSALLLAWLCPAPAAEPKNPTAPTNSLAAILIPFRKLALASPTEAKLRQLSGDEGDTVSKDQPLALLYSETEEIEAKKAAKVLEKAERDLRSTERLASEKVLSEEKLVEQRLLRDIAQLEKDRADANLRDKTLAAPWDGFILRRLAEEGEIVVRGKPLFELVDYSQIYVQFYAEAALLGTFTKGSTLEVEIPGSPARRLKAAIRMIDPIVDPGSGLFRVKLLVPNPDFQIKPGIEARVLLNASQTK